MTEQTANRIANVVLGAAAIGAAYAVLRVPALRRLVVGLAATAAMSGAPEWLRREVQHAWVESGALRQARNRVGAPGAPAARGGSAAI